MPQTIMLAVHCKKAESLEFKAPLVEYARAAYGAEVRTQRRLARGWHSGSLC